ncbi:CGNR zinc finger domain-containing protein [Cohnella sp.]|uniref:CGNR zinc finger domain-containing protein n=1 Tax=Cohnella sp. TaxID=1883426 RepID=UPI0035687D32
MERAMFTIGGSVWINLANTFIMRNKRRIDTLEEPRNVLRWLVDNELLTRESGLDQIPDSFYRELVSLRELCADALADLLREGRLSEQTYAVLANEASILNVKVRIDRHQGQPVLIYEGRSLADRLRYAILDSLADLLNKYPPERIRKCEHEECIIHFVDTSKSGRRRWCSMDLCGNRQKAAEFYAKKKERTLK